MEARPCEGPPHAASAFVCGMHTTPFRAGRVHFMAGKALAHVSLIALVAGCMLAGSAAGCTSTSHPTGPEEQIGSVGEQLTSSAALQLEVLTNSCGVNQLQDFFQITNTGGTSIPLSQITIKLWADDTSGQTLVSQIDTGGCLTNASGCFHNVSGVTTAAKSFSPACGPDPTNQANWEITISNTDSTSIAPGQTWTGDELALRLANSASFSPGTADWYSPCLKGSSYAFDGHYAVFVGGNLVTASTGVPPSCRATTGQQTIAGEVPPGLGTTYPLVGPLPGPTPITLAISLPLVTPPGGTPIQTFVQDVSNPQSPSFRKYLTPGLFASTYGPSVADYNALQKFATTSGLTVGQTYLSRDLLTVTGTAAAIESAFNVTLNVYKRPDGTTFYAPANTPSYTLPTLTNPILHVAGFDNLSVPVPASGSSTVSCFDQVGTGTTQSGYYGQDVRNLYLGTGCSLLPTSSLPSTATPTPCPTSATLPSVPAGTPGSGFGAGQTVALMELDTYNPTNITGYANGTKLLPASASALCAPSGLSNITQVLVSSTPATTTQAFNAAPLFTLGSAPNEAEVELGIEMVLAMAPQASIVVYEQNAGSEVGLTNNQFNADIMLEALAQPVPGTNLAPAVIANSWLWNSSTGPDASIPQYFLHFAAQGQSFFQAAGDLGAYASGNPFTGVPDPIIDSSLMTVVGGTAVVPVGGGATQEEAWNDPNERTTDSTVTGINCTSATLSSTTLESAACNSVGGGGICTPNSAQTALGYSNLAIPTYQTAVNINNNKTLSTTSRMIPDVSIIADSLASVTVGQAACSEGTSASVALWAAYAAITNELSSGVGAVGFANPELYFLASSSSTYSLNFHDITSGANGYVAGDGFSAVADYDLATGLGSPLGSSCNLLTALPTQSCMSATSVTALVQGVGGGGSGGTVTAYVPAGSYEETPSGVFAVQIEAAPTAQGTPLVYSGTLAPPVGITTTTTSDPGPSADGDLALNGSVINTCAANPQSNPPTVICSSNGKTVWVINAVTNTATPMIDPNVPEATSGGGGIVEQFTGGSCATCNVAIDSVHQVAYLSIATGSDDGRDSTGGAFDTLNLATNPPTFGTSPIQLGQEATSEDIVVDPLRGFILSPNEGFFETGEASTPGNYQLVNTSTGGVFSFDNTGGPSSASVGGGFDSAAEDCTTGIALSSDEFTNEIFLVDLNQAQFNTPSAGLWTSATGTTPGFNFFTIPEFANLTNSESGAATIVVAPHSHIAVVGGEFGGSTFAVINLPPTAGGTPTIGPYVVANIPNTPTDNLPWQFGADPHTLTAYQSPNVAKPYAVFEDDPDINTTFDGLRTWLAVVDLTALANAHNSSSPLVTRLGANGTTANTLTLTTTDTCTSTAPTAGLDQGVNPPGCIIRFVGIPSTQGGLSSLL
jgi:hypothetical protein